MADVLVHPMDIAARGGGRRGRLSRAAAAGKGKDFYSLTGALRIDGIDGVMRALDQFEKKVIRKIERKALRAAGKPVLASAKRMAPIADEYDIHDDEHQAGTLQKSLRLRVLKSNASRRRAGIYGVRVQAGRESHLFKGEQFYGGFVELGTKHQAAQGFMAAAAQENQARSRQIFYSEISRYVKELGKVSG